MDITDAVVVVTGGASGIGRAIAERCIADGARYVAIADLGEERTCAVAEQIGAHAVVGDVSTHDGVAALISTVEAAAGTIDLFVANAGIGVGTDPMTTTEAEWDQIWRINSMQHVWAARELLPTWLERKRGYLLTTASAAGLLSQIGSAPYSMTKAAAVSFAEWMSITYGGQGIVVSCLCPQGVNTPLLNGPGELGSESIGASAVKAGGNVLEPADVAAIVSDAIRDERFLILPHPEVQTYLERKATDRPRWIAGMRRLQDRLSAP
jgi:NAD(P)-dependent dehydrogenase (short-subunit alcohol dehydrogenase family)